MALTRETMTDEQRKSVVLDCLKAFDNVGVIPTGGSILDLFADDAQVYFPKWGLATGKEQISKLFTDVGTAIKHIEHHYAHFNWVFPAATSSCAKVPATGSTKMARGEPTCRSGGRPVV
jgi:hypothetical protein